MKKVFISTMIIMFCFSLAAQDRSSVKATVSVDEFSGSMSVRTERWTNFGQNDSRHRISANMVSTDGEVIAISITYSGDLGCLSQNRSKMLVKLTNDEVIEFTQISRTDCSNSPSAVFLPITSEESSSAGSIDDFKNLALERIEELKEADWVAIRLHGSRYYTDIRPNSTRSVPNPEQFFRQHILAVQQAIE